MASLNKQPSTAIVAHNVRRLMAKEGISHGDLVAAAGMDDRTLRGVLRGENQTRPSTLNKIASGLGVPVEALFQPPLGLSPAAFDIATNPAVERAIAASPELFEGWGTHEYSEIASRFGVGGELTEEGVVEAAHAMNARRELIAKARVILESEHADLLSGMIEVLHERICLNA